MNNCGRNSDENFSSESLLILFRDNTVLFNYVVILKVLCYNNNATLKPQFNKIYPQRVRYSKKRTLCFTIPLRVIVVKCCNFGTKSLRFLVCGSVRSCTLFLFTRQSEQKEKVICRIVIFRRISLVLYFLKLCVIIPMQHFLYLL